MGEKDIPQIKHPQKGKARENHRAEQLEEEEAWSNNSKRVGKVKRKEKR